MGFEYQVNRTYYYLILRESIIMYLHVMYTLHIHLYTHQMRSIVNNIRPDRQTVLFSATMKRKIEGFAYDILRVPVRVAVGNVGQANPDIRQVRVIIPMDVTFRHVYIYYTYMVLNMTYHTNSVCICYVTYIITYGRSFKFSRRWGRSGRGWLRTSTSL